MKANDENLLWMVLKKCGPVTLTESEQVEFAQKKHNLCEIAHDKNHLDNSLILKAVERSEEYKKSLQLPKTVNYWAEEMIDDIEYNKKTLEEWGDDVGKKEQHGDGT